MKLRALIADDMPLSRDRVRRYLGEEPDVEIVGECGDAQSTLGAIARLKPDVLMLDVQMPGANGFELVARLPAEARPALVFITAFEEFAVQAFAAEAVDYLLKPFDHDRLRQALAKVRAYLKNRRAAPARTAPAHYLDPHRRQIGRADRLCRHGADRLDRDGRELSVAALRQRHPSGARDHEPD